MSRPRVAVGTCPLLAIVACAPAPAPVEPPAPSETAARVGVAAPAPPAPSSSATWLEPDEIVARWRERMGGRAVTEATIARRVLFSWTTQEQADAIADGGAILSRVESPAYGPSGFDWMLDDGVARGDALAKLLFHEGFAKKRFAWPSAAATAFGAGGTDYGAILMKIELAEGSVVVDWPRRRALVVGGGGISLDAFAAKPELLAAVYWEAEGYREYVVVNEARIARVSFGTPAVVEAFAREAEDAVALQADLRRLPSSATPSLVDLFASTLAFATPSEVAELERFAEHLPKRQVGGSRQVARQPRVSFALGAPRARLTVDCRLVETRDMTFERRMCLPTGKCAFTERLCGPARASGLQTGER